VTALLTLESGEHRATVEARTHTGPPLYALCCGSVVDVGDCGSIARRVCWMLAHGWAVSERFFPLYPSPDAVAELMAVRARCLK
jgi:hypothetical protein